MIDLTPDYSPKVLHIGIRDPTLSPKKRSPNGLVYAPSLVYSKINTYSENMYEDLFSTGSEVVILPIRTEQGPGELVKRLKKDFGIVYGTIVGGITARFTATPEQAQRMMKKLKSCPKKYFPSIEKKEFGGGFFLPTSREELVLLQR